MPVDIHCGFAAVLHFTASSGSLASLTTLDRTEKMEEAEHGPRLHVALIDMTKESIERHNDR
jgi:hypothetical protein